MKKRISAMLLCLCMVATFLPATARAADGESPASPLLSQMELSIEGESSEAPCLFVSDNYVGDATKNFTFPCQPGKTGNLRFLYDGTKAEVTQSGKSLDMSGEEDDDYYVVALDQGRTITITLTSKPVDPETGSETYTETYTIALDTFDIGPETFEILGTDGGTENPVAAITPAYNVNRTEYTILAPADTETIPVRITPQNGGEISLSPESSPREEDKNIYDIPLDYGIFSLYAVRGYVTQEYTFNIVRGTDAGEKAPVTDDLFEADYENIPVYDGNPHKDLIKASSLLDRNRLTVTYDNRDTFETEALTAVTDAGSYYVYVAYAGDDVYEATPSRILCPDGGDPVTVYVRPAEAKAVNVPEGSVTIGAHASYYGLDLNGMKVVDGGGRELPGEWGLDFYAKGSVTEEEDGYIFSDDRVVAPNVGGTYDAIAYYMYDRSLKNNYSYVQVQLTVTIEKTTITEKDIGAVWYKDGEDFDYLGDFGDFPRLLQDNLLTIVGERQVGEAWVVNYTESYHFEDASGREMTEADGVRVEDGYLASGPNNAGTYRYCVTFKLDESVKDQFAFADGSDTLVLKKEYTIKPVEVSATVWIDPVLDGNGKIKALNLRDSVKVNGFQSGDIYILTLRKDGIPVELEEKYLYTLKDDETGTFTYTIDLTDKINYKFTADSVTTASVSTDAVAVIPVTGAGASVTHPYSAGSSGGPEEFSGTISLRGVPAGKDVSCMVTGVYIQRKDGNHDTESDHDRIPGGGYTAWVSLALTGKDAGGYILRDNSVEVPCTVTKRSLADSEVWIELVPESASSPRGYEYKNGAAITPSIESVHIVGMGDVAVTNFTVSYQNNTLPSVDGGPSSGRVLAKVIITAKPDSHFTDSASGTFSVILPSGSGVNGEYTVALKGGETKDFLAYIHSDAQITIDDSSVVSAAVVRNTDSEVKLTITGKAAGQAIVMLKGKVNNDGAEACYLYGVTVTDGTAAPGHVHAWDSAWSSDSANHWHNCTAANCTVSANSDKAGYGAHVYDNERDTSCNICGDTRTISSGSSSGGGSSGGGSSGGNTPPPQKRTRTVPRPPRRRTRPPAP